MTDNHRPESLQSTNTRGPDPQPGFFRLRLVKGGPFVPSRIWRGCCCTVNGGYTNAQHRWRDTCDRYPPLQGEINGSPADPQRIWDSGWPITNPEFDHLTAVRNWAETHAPAAPEANPRRRIDLHTMPPLF